MPLYEYHCSDCDREVELLVRKETEAVACPECGGTGLAKLFSVPVAHSGNGGPPPPEGPCGSSCGCFPTG